MERCRYRLGEGRAVKGAKGRDDVTVVTERVKRANSFGVRSAKQLALYVDKLRRAKTLKAFFHWHTSGFQGKKSDWANVFKFLRACEYSLPEYFGAAEMFVKNLRPKANYSFFIGALVSWYRMPAVKELEDQGMPAQISERFIRSNDTADSLADRVRKVAMSTRISSPLLKRNEF